MIGIICAMQIEADGILAACENKNTTEIAGMNYISGTVGGRNVVVVVCGVGKVNAAMCALAMIERFHPDVVINSGVAGAVSPLVTIGDLVIADKSVEHDMNTEALGDKRGEVFLPNGKMTYFECDRSVAGALCVSCERTGDVKYRRGIIASGDLFVSDKRKRLRINDTFGALACEMEGAAIGHVCCCCGTPYGILRAISDDLSDNKGVDFARFCELASKRTVAVMLDFVSTFES